ncbi:nuclease-related domain-containing protein [Kyrpidia spormannii]|uniref:NERD domain-containing protein n=1 Tax=Kyrpidia spormannii TaxID=2055160 RepID=A0A6F9EF18_9BACL|nr:nuclease-related domain-containing protein [Kyrpidia spormannii]CAB3395479.1 conserved protein of unknown function [Kyrpidia spormannii]
MILQVPQADQKALDQLENLLQMLPSSHKKRPVIERELRMLLSGRTGEKNVAYQLEFWYKDAADVVVANDLRFEYNGRSVQIDHFVALPAGFLVIESKSLPDHIYIDEAGNWFRMARGKRRVEDREGMSNPIEQNKRHIAVLQELFGSVAHGGVPPLANVIVFPHPKVVVRGSKPAGAYLLRVDQLHTFIEKLRGSKPGPGTASTFDLIKLALTYHRPLVFDPYERYHIDKKDVLPLSRRIEFDVKQKAYLCVFCAAKMALQRDRNGLFWGCPNNPQCKNRVPASVAVQIGTEAVERSEKDKDFLTWLFTDKPRLCPNCGDILQRKKSRNKEYWACPNVTLCRYRGS